MIGKASICSPKALGIFVEYYTNLSDMKLNNSLSAPTETLRASVYFEFDNKYQDLKKALAFGTTGSEPSRGLKIMLPFLKHLRRKPLR